MNKLLWGLQILLALMFAFGGAVKAMTPPAELAEQMAWAARVPAWAPVTAGVAEVLAAIGLILPAATRIKPSLTPLAAAGLVVVMLLAAFWVHAPAGEWGAAGTNLVLGALAGFVAYGRWKLAPIPVRSEEQTARVV